MARGENARVPSAALATALGMVLLISSSQILCAPAVTNLVAAQTSVGLYDVFTVSFDVQTSATNPFWPYDPSPPVSIPAGTGVTVDGLFTNDNWATTVTAPGFYYQEYTRQLVDTKEYAVPTGEPHWSIRFAPKSIGTWRYKIRVQDRSGTVTFPSSGDYSFNCTASQNRGFLGPSSTDSRYFETSDGRPLLGPSVNASLQTTAQADALFETCGANGVTTVRWWMDYRGWQNPFGGGDVATKGGPQWSFSLSMSGAGGRKPGDRYCAVVNPAGNTKQGVYLSAGLLYRLSGYVRTDGVPTDPGKGGVLYIGAKNGTILQSTQDWTLVTIDYTPSTSGVVSVGCKNTADSGTVYFDDLSLKSSSDGGKTWSSECLAKGDMDFENYIDLGEAWKVDRIFESAQQHGVYLKTVISEKQDTSLGCINLDGSTGARSDNNFYASDNHPSRWLQKAWWRYMTARWGCYTSLHSWELCNEGDPFNGNHWNAASALASYVHSVDPNKAMCTTSFWHSIPMDFWKSSTCDYIDVHEYTGPTTPGSGSHGPRFYAWTDPQQSASNIDSVPTGMDRAVTHLGANAYRVNAPASADTFAWGYPEYHVGIDPSHTYTVRYWAKADNIANQGNGLAWTRPRLGISWSAAYHENDYVGAVSVDADLGTYDWQQYTQAGIHPPASANTANISVASPCNPDHPSTFWVDDIEFIDETTGKNLYVDGGFEGDRIDYDTALAVKKYGVLLNSYGDRIGRPAIWGETGIRGPNVYGTPYKGYSYTEENQQLVDDTDGIYLRKMIWAHAGPDNPNIMLWWTDNIEKKNLWHYFRAFQDFLSGIPLSNGNYKDAEATTTAPALRAWGQKDLTANRAHLWIDNAPYTWKAVVDHNYRPEPWDSTATYANGSTCGGGTPTHIYRSLQDNNKNHPVTDTAWWEDTGEFNAANNPPLPPPVSGTVTVSGFKDGDYKAEWWDTSTGVITKTEDVQCTGGEIALSVQNLVSDIACKIYPAPARIGLRVLVPSSDVVPGQVVTVTVEYTNSGEVDAGNVTVQARVPAEMDYVEGSAEESGGTWDAATGTVSWVVDNVPAHGTGTRTFKAKVR